MKKIIIWMILASPLFMGVSCKKLKFDFSKQIMPPITQQGLNTFGFMFGKEMWVPRPFSFTFPSLKATYRLKGNDRILKITCSRTSSVLSSYSDDFEIECINPTPKTGAFELNEQNCSIEALVTKSDQISKVFNLYKTGTLNITRWDLKERILSGTFSMNIKEKTSGEIVVVSDGRFDLIFTE